MTKPRFKNWSHIHSKCQSWDLNPHFSNSEVYLPTISCHSSNRRDNNAWKHFVSPKVSNKCNTLDVSLELRAILRVNFYKIKLKGKLLIINGRFILEILTSLTCSNLIHVKRLHWAELKPSERNQGKPAQLSVGHNGLNCPPPQQVAWHPGKGAPCHCFPAHAGWPAIGDFQEEPHTDWKWG